MVATSKKTGGTRDAASISEQKKSSDLCSWTRRNVNERVRKRETKRVR
jgi:hypothetical protein